MLAQGPGHHFGPNALSGSSVYELTFDGYRPVLRVTDRGAELWLRIGFDLSAVSRTSLRLPRRICLAVWSLTLNLGYGCGRLCFDHLQQRMTARAVGVAGLARQRPATFIAFDLLSVVGEDFRPRPCKERRAAREAIGSCRRPLQLSPSTSTTPPPGTGSRLTRRHRVEV
jgi:ATP-dependent DNA ligase